MPFILTEDQRKAIANRVMVQPPQSEHDLAEFQQFSREVKRISGFEADVLIRLETLAHLADQGNLVAGYLYAEACKELGITFPRHFTFST